MSSLIPGNTLHCAKPTSCPSMLFSEGLESTHTYGSFGGGCCSHPYTSCKLSGAFGKPAVTTPITIWALLSYTVFIFTRPAAPKPKVMSFTEMHSTRRPLTNWVCLQKKFCGYRICCFAGCEEKLRGLLNCALCVRVNQRCKRILSYVHICSNHMVF